MSKHFIEAELLRLIRLKTENCGKNDDELRRVKERSAEYREALATLYDKCGPLVEGLSDDATPTNYVLILADNLLCIKQAMFDAECALERGEADD